MQKVKPNHIRGPMENNIHNSTARNLKFAGTMMALANIAFLPILVGVEALWPNASGNVAFAASSAYLLIILGSLAAKLPAVPSDGPTPSPD
jgi:hypothetical protein